MQAILSRLRASHDPNISSEPTVAQTHEDDTITKPSLNVFVKERTKQELIDVDNLEILTDVNGTRQSDDSDDEIDIVMASNKTGLRTRGRSSGVSPRESLKTSRTRGSRVSLNSVATSEKEDISVIDCGESDEEIASQRRSKVLTPMQAWAAFENTVKNIDNSNPYMFKKKPKPNFESSGVFQKVMVDMYGNTEYGNTKGYTLLKKKLNNMARASTMATKMLFCAAQKGKEDRENEGLGEEDFDDLDPGSGEPESVKTVFARRGWKMLKRQVHETAMEQKTQTGKLNWTMLQHTLKQMSNVERTRQDLYERYGVVPTVQEDGTVKCENRMLSERARAQLQSKKDGGRQDIKRPHSYQPPPTHLRSPSQTGFQKNGKNKKSKNKPPSAEKIRRPVTSMR